MHKTNEISRTEISRTSLAATPRYTLKQEACAAAAHVSAAAPPVSMGGAGLAPGMPGGEGLR